MERGTREAGGKPSTDGKPGLPRESRRLAPGGEEAAATWAARALLFATAPAEDGGPAALLPLAGTTVLGRLLGQLQTLGVGSAFLVTRPEWEELVAAAASHCGAAATVLAADDVGDDLRLTADIAVRSPGQLVVAGAHMITQQAVLTAMLADPRRASRVLVTGSPGLAPASYPVRSTPGRVLSASSPYHRVEGATGCSLGLMTIDDRDRQDLAEVSRRLAELVTRRPSGWDEELERKAAHPQLERPVPADDVVALLLVGLVRNGVGVRPHDLGRLFYAAPLSSRAGVLAAEDLGRHDEDRALLDSAVKTNDSPFTTLLVSPYSKYLARFAARRGWSPDQVTALSFAVGVAAAAAFALGTRGTMIAGAVLLQLSFVLDCVDGQLARYTRTFSSFGGWLDAVLDRMKEYVLYGGLALGAARGFEDDVWVLAAAALTVQTARHISDFAYVAKGGASAAAAPAAPLEDPEDAPLPRLGGGAAARLSSRWLRRANQLVRLPIGERFALISLTAAIASPRVTFAALLVWGGIAAVYALAVRVVVSYSARARILGVVLK